MQLNSLNAQSSPQPLSNYMVDADWEYVCTMQDKDGKDYSLLVHPSVLIEASYEEAEEFQSDCSGVIPTIDELKAVYKTHGNRLRAPSGINSQQCYVWSSTETHGGLGRRCLDFKDGVLERSLMWEQFGVAGAVIVKREYLRFVD